MKEKVTLSCYKHLSHNNFQSEKNKRRFTQPQINNTKYRMWKKCQPNRKLLKAFLHNKISFANECTPRIAFRFLNF